MKAYKGFDKDLKCRGFQYEIGKEYTEEKAELCDCGFHACEAPLDVFNYYAPADSRFCEVDIDDNGQRQNDDSKVCGKTIKIGAEIGLPGLIKAHIEYIKSKAEYTETNTGNYSASTNTGDRSASTNTGDYSASTNTGYRSASTNTGDCSASTNTGDCSASTNTGYRSASTNTGDYSASTNTGYRSASTNTGDCSASTNTGDCSASEVSGIGSVALATGRGSKAKASIGSAIVIVERGEWNGETYPMLGIKAAIVDGKKIKADTWYKLVNGKFVEVNE